LFDQLTAEKVVTKYHHGHARLIWVKVRPRSEALDCRVLNVAALGVLLSMGFDLAREALKESRWSQRNQGRKSVTHDRG
jgi:phage terminase large subunit GpA-like protein